MNQLNAARADAPEEEGRKRPVECFLCVLQPRPWTLFAGFVQTSNNPRRFSSSFHEVFAIALAIAVAGQRQGKVFGRISPWLRSGHRPKSSSRRRA